MFAGQNLGTCFHPYKGQRLNTILNLRFSEVNLQLESGASSDCERRGVRRLVEAEFASAG